MAEIRTFTDFAGKRKDGTRVPATMPQFDGSTYASGNCAAASEAVRDIVEIAKRITPGSPWPPTGAVIRTWTGDTTGGLRPTQTARVSKIHYDIDSDIRIVDIGVMDSKLRGRFGVTLLVRYKPISDAGYSASPGFTGNHSISLLGIRGTGTATEYLMSDPLRDGRREGIPFGTVWIKASVIRRAAGDLELLAGESLIESHGAGKAYCSFTIHAYVPPVPPKPTVTLRYGGVKNKRPKRVRVLYNRTNLRSSPRKSSRNVVRLVSAGYTFDVYQHVVTASGNWLGNRDGTRWLFKSGTVFVKYL